MESMDHMMMESAGPMIWGMSFESFLMLAAGIIYIICAYVIWKPYRKEKNELIGALFAFLVYQAFAMVLMGVEMHTMQMVYSNLAALAIFIGSAYMLKFPFSSFSKGTRKLLFLISIVIVLGLFVWFIQTPEREMELMKFSLYYDLVINGIIVGGSILLLGLRVSQKWLKVKAYGGGAGVVACCVVSNSAMLSGAMLTSSFFAFLAPLLIVGTLMLARQRS